MNETENKPVSVGDWILTFILLAIPLVNIIMLFVWAFGESAQPSKKTFAKAQLIIFGVIICLSILFGVLAAMTGFMISSHPAS
jgi:membrane protein YdbS with pleckstrin-like domain